MSGLPPLTPTESAGNRLSQAREARSLKRAEDVARQAAERTVVDDYTVQPAIGHTGSAANLGWEVIPPTGLGPPWYLSTRQLAIQAIPKHRARYA